VQTPKAVQTMHYVAYLDNPNRSKGGANPMIDTLIAIYFGMAVSIGLTSGTVLCLSSLLYFWRGGDNAPR
jgi:hypothetical protein